MNYDLSDPFWTAVDRRPCGCWVREGGTPKGNGSRRIGRVLSHVIAYKLAVGPVPDGYLVFRNCGDRMCVNPDHLYLKRKVL